MAETHYFAGSNHHFGPPPGQEDRVGWLHIFGNLGGYVSAWKPTPEHLAILNAGGSIFMSVQGGSRGVVTARTLEGGIKEVKKMPYVFPVFVGSEEEVKGVLSRDGQEVW